MRRSETMSPASMINDGFLDRDAARLGESFRIVGTPVKVRH